MAANSNSSVQLSFPKDFIFGIAESDLQTVGSQLPQVHENAQKTMWETFTEKENIDQPLFGTHKFTHWKDDVANLQKLGVKAYRTSISMSRTIDAFGKPNKKALKWYRNYFEAIKSSNIDFHLCLYHWEAPSQFTKLGILDPHFNEYFKKHTEITLDYFSDLVDYFIPINELWCINFLSYYVGMHAPGFQDISKFFKAYFSSLTLQANTIRQIKAHSSKNKIGIVNIHFPAYIQPQHTDNKTYITAQKIADNVTNYMYSDPFFLGTIDPIVVKKFKKYFPKNYQKILRETDVHNLINYYGINYYSSQYVKPSSTGLLYDQEIPEGAITNSLGWPVSVAPYYPNGLTDILLSYTHRYAHAGLKEIVVSENGTPEYTPLYKGKIPQDNFRIFYMKAHLQQVQAALAKGAPVKGYFAWSLIDNYEWQEGYSKESAFGLMTLDPKTGERIPKKSFFWYNSLLKAHYE